jgi:ABC-2 type transport system ATP-binding protein
VLQARLFGLSPEEATERTHGLLALVELEDAADRRIKGYSGGMKRRLDLASALVHEPEVLFLDEPTTGLDPVSRLTVWDEVRRINERGTTVFLTTQYLEEADQLCDRLAIIDDGCIVREGTPAQLKGDLRERRGLASEPTLDDVFLDATGRTRGRVEGDVQEVTA